MTIVRELITKLSFQVDKKGIESFNRTVSSFRTKFTLLASTATAFVAGLTKAASTVSDQILDTDELARSIGIATRDLVGLQRAARALRLSPDEFVAGFVQLDTTLKNARQGFGELFKIMEQNQDLNFRDANGNILDTLSIFKILIKRLEEITDESERARIATNLFGNRRFANLGREGAKNFFNLANSLTPLGEKFEENRDRAERFERALNRLGETARELSFSIFPPLIERLAQTFESLNSIIEVFRGKGFINTLFPKEPIKDALDAFFGSPETRENALRAIQEDQASFGQNISRRVDINTRIEITPPTGTTAEQREFFVSAAREAFTENFNDRFLEMATDFPKRA